MYKYIFFDLDGTLLNTFRGVSNGVRYTMEFYGLPVPEGDEMRKYLGPPLRHSFSTFAGIPDEKLDEAIAKFREYYFSKGTLEYEFFEDLKPSFARLREMGCKLAVATSKLEKGAFIILKDADLIDEFDFICGSTQDESRSSKDQVVAHVLEHFGITDKSEVLLVGDRDNDIIGAHKNGIKCCGFLSGFGSREEMEENGADYIINYISDIFDIL
ncbi:MAG: HAD hydrolase-like protein [Ruminiclostridium sp.]|nr:HAD hydrolase-like protein [Ruminiclostridium sp.]